MAQVASSGSDRDAINDIWGPRAPFKHEWPVRVDETCIEEPEKWVQSACVLCSNGCGMDIGVKDGRMVGVRGRAVDRVNKGRLGPKGMNGWTSQRHKDRLRYPMIRKNGKLTQASWDEAMDLIVKKSKKTVERLTAHGIGFYTSGQLFLEEYYTLAVIGKAGLNTLHMDGNTRLCTATAAAAMRESFGSDGQPGSYTDIDFTDCIFMVGHNMAETQTVLWCRILDRLAGPDPPKLIVVDSRLSTSAKSATIHLAPKVGTNMALLNGIIHLLFADERINSDYVENHTIGASDLRKIASEYPPHVVEKITGVPETQLREAAKVLGTTKSLLSTVLQGVYQSNQATASSCQVNNINLLLGLIGKKGSGIYQMNGQPTAQNNREAGCDGEFPGFRNHSNPDHMQELADLWNIDYNLVPHWNIPTHVQNILNYMESGTIQMLWVSGTNPLVSLPNLPRVRELFTKDDLFLVCQDIFMTETAAIADVVLPAAQWGEKTGCFTNVDRTVHLSHKAVDPPGEARSDLEIFVDYASRMDFQDKDGNQLIHWKDAEQAFKAFGKMTHGRPCDYSGLTYDKLTGGSGIQWPCNDNYPYGRERLFEDGQFFTDIDYCESFGHDLETGTPLTKDEYYKLNPAGRAILKSCHYRPSAEAVNEDYPLQLNTGRNVFHFHTRTKTGRSRPLEGALSEPYVELSTDDAAEAEVDDGDEVVVSSRRASVQLKVKINSGSKAGRVFIPFHFGYFDAHDGRARAANELTREQWDPISKQPQFKSGAVRIAKVLRQNGQVKIHVKEQQTRSEKAVGRKKVNAAAIEDDSARSRYLERWLGVTYASIHELVDIYDEKIPLLVKDREVLEGLIMMKELTREANDLLKPFAEKYKFNEDLGLHTARKLRNELFPRENEYFGSYATLETLLALEVYYAAIKAHLSALIPVSQALTDGEFHTAVMATKEKVEKMIGWAAHQASVRSPQTLIVPARVE